MSVVIVCLQNGNSTCFQDKWGTISDVWIELCLFVWGFTSHSRIFHSYGDVTITGEGFLACHTYCDTGYPFIIVISEDPWHSRLLPVAERGGLLRFEHPTFRKGGEQSNRLCHRRGLKRTRQRVDTSKKSGTRVFLYIRVWESVKSLPTYPKSLIINGLILYTWLCNNANTISWKCLFLLIIRIVKCLNLFSFNVKFFSHMETSQLYVKDFKFWPILSTRSHWAVKVL